MIAPGWLRTVARRPKIPPEVQGLAAGSASALAAIDIVYVAKRRVAPTYLLDASAQLMLLGGLASAAAVAVPGR